MVAALCVAILLGRVVFPLASPTVLISTYLHLISRQILRGINTAFDTPRIFGFFFLTPSSFLFAEALGGNPQRRPGVPGRDKHEFSSGDLLRAAVPFFESQAQPLQRGRWRHTAKPRHEALCALAGFDMCVSTKRFVANTSLCIPTKVQSHFHWMAW